MVRDFAVHFVTVSYVFIHISQGFLTIANYVNQEELYNRQEPNHNNIWTTFLGIAF